MSIAATHRKPSGCSYVVGDGLKLSLDLVSTKMELACWTLTLRVSNEGDSPSLLFCTLGLQQNAKPSCIVIESNSPGGRKIELASKGPCRDTSSPVLAIAAMCDLKGASASRAPQHQNLC